MYRGVLGKISGAANRTNKSKGFLLFGKWY